MSRMVMSGLAEVIGRFPFACQIMFA